MFSTILTIAVAVGTALSLVLHAIAPKTKTLLDDQVEAVVDEVLQYLGQVDSSGTPKRDEPAAV
jgi:phage-related protein